jgi:hypothetical protein
MYIIVIPSCPPSSGARAGTSGSVMCRTRGRDLGVAEPNPDSVSVGNAIETGGRKE